MKNVAAPTGSHFDSFKSLVRRKHSGVNRTILKSIFRVIEARYDEYDHKKEKPELVTIVKRAKKTKAALKSCYENSGKFKAGRVAVKTAAIPTPRCPYCQIDPARTWDHFLPASQFPDYYVYPPNLVRVCNECNEGKNVGRVHPTRKTIHPYFDPLSMTRYLKCTVKRRKELAVAFNIDPDRTTSGYDSYVEGVVRQHFKYYGLARKYRAESSRKIADFKFVIEQLWLTTKKLPTANMINRIINSKKKQLVKQGEGPNSWEVVFWDGMKNCSGLLDYAKELIGNL